MSALQERSQMLSSVLHPNDPTCVCVCVCVCVYIYIYIYIYQHMYMLHSYRSFRKTVTKVMQSYTRFRVTVSKVMQCAHVLWRHAFNAFTTASWRALHRSHHHRDLAMPCWFPFSAYGGPGEHRVRNLNICARRHTHTHTHTHTHNTIT